MEANGGIVLSRLLKRWAPNLTSLALHSSNHTNVDDTFRINVFRGLKSLGSLRHLYLFDQAPNKALLPRRICRQLDSLFIGEIFFSDQFRIPHSIEVGQLIRSLTHLKSDGLTCRLWLDAQLMISEFLESLSRMALSNLSSQITHLNASVDKVGGIKDICRVFTSVRFLKLNSELYLVRLAIG